MVRQAGMNKVVIITGGSSGIGAAAARALRAEGATVAITGRSEETLRLAGEIGARGFLVDFARLSEVRSLAGRLLSVYPRIDVLANNAGTVVANRQVTEDGHEETLQVNHLAGFLLTLLLRERLEESGATVINTSSGMQRFGVIDFTDFENQGGYDPMRAYGTTKLMNILHAAEISRQFRGVHGVSFRPGGVATGIARGGTWWMRWLYGPILGRLLLMPAEKGADTLVWLATTRPGADWTPGACYRRRLRSEVKPEANDLDLARELWESSEAAVG
ncbi:MAG TPA: SDR family NAD(P)-dependent oxidoreductase [Thermoanaerobaculia bacterium]|nr:SDR family NAD(P)-dependent oxidoreductase [Thermoanaerobaculia bacterium]